MKVVKPTSSSRYVTTTDTTSWRYLPNYNRARREWVKRLRDTLRGTDVVFVDNYALQESQPLTQAFSDARRGDGLHLSREAANSLALLVKGIIERELSVKGSL